MSALLILFWMLAVFMLVRDAYKSWLKWRDEHEFETEWGWGWWEWGCEEFRDWYDGEPIVLRIRSFGPVNLMYYV